jgi:hypothetical protein
MKQTLIKTTGAIVFMGVIFVAVWTLSPKQTPFCFNFVRDMQFGDRTVKNPVNQGIQGVRGMMYFPVEMTALHTVLNKEGYSVDPLEATGGKMYMGAFYGPTTQGAIREFQKKNSIKETGVVDNDTIDLLAKKYSCPVSIVATSTPATTTPSK